MVVTWLTTSDWSHLNEILNCRLELLLYMFMWLVRSACTSIVPVFWLRICSLVLSLLRCFFGVFTTECFIRKCNTDVAQNQDSQNWLLATCDSSIYGCYQLERKVKLSISSSITNFQMRGRALHCMLLVIGQLLHVCLGILFLNMWTVWKKPAH